MATDEIISMKNDDIEKVNYSSTEKNDNLKPTSSTNMDVDTSQKPSVTDVSVAEVQTSELVTKVEPVFTQETDNHCIVNESDKVPSPTSIDTVIVKIEQTENPIDFSSKTLGSEYVEKSKSKEKCTQKLDYVRDCALDYTINTLNKAAESETDISGSLDSKEKSPKDSYDTTNKSSPKDSYDITNKSSPKDSFDTTNKSSPKDSYDTTNKSSPKDSYDTTNKSHDGYMCQSCDQTFTSSQDDLCSKPTSSPTALNLSSQINDMQCDSSIISVNDRLGKYETKVRDAEKDPVKQSKNVLNDTTTLLDNTNSLLKDTNDLLKNTSDLLSDTESCLFDQDSSKYENDGKSDTSDVGIELMSLSAEEYKSQHKIGSRRSSENVLTYNNPVIQPYLPGSPEKVTKKNVTKRKICVDEIAEHLAKKKAAISVDDITEHLSKKRAVVSLGERVKENHSNIFVTKRVNQDLKANLLNSNSLSKGDKLELKSLSNESLSETEQMQQVEKLTSDSPKKEKSCSAKSSIDGKTKSPKAKKKPSKSSKRSDIFSFPSRRIKREASLNASARVNILYEKDNISPKSRKLSNSSSSSGKNVNKQGAGNFRRSVSNESLSGSKITKHRKVDEVKPKCHRSKSLECESVGKKHKKKTSDSKDGVIKKPKNKSVSSDEGLKGNDTIKVKKKAAKDEIARKSKSLKQIQEDLRKKKLKETIEKNKKTKKRKISEDQKEGKAKKVKIESLKSARTHVMDNPKSDYTIGTQCVKCCQHMCPQNRKYWNGKDDSQTVKDDEKILDNSSALPVDVTSPYSVPTVQLMEGSPYVVPHGHLGMCHACAQGGGNIMPTSHSYTLSGIGSLSQMMPYHQAYGGGYPVPFPPAGNTALPHCGCPTCYSAQGVYYPQTSTPITHQPLQHEPCMVPHPVHIPNEESEFIDVVGGDSDSEPLSSQVRLLPPVKTDKILKKRTSKQESSKKKKNLSKVNKHSKVKFTKTKSKITKLKKKKKDKKLKKKIKPKTVKKPQYKKSVSKHGWEFHGKPDTRKIMCHSVGSVVERNCYPSIRHSDGDVIHVRDCVLLRSGPRKVDIPFIAKVKAFWEDPLSREMMMSILWFYQPEHIEGGRKTHHLLCELFASKHKDENCVACIEDKGYVLTYGEYCRYMAEQRRRETFFPPREIVVPDPAEEYPGKGKLPPAEVDPNTVFVCRQVYDFKLKRILKNPS